MATLAAACASAGTLALLVGMVFGWHFKRMHFKKRACDRNHPQATHGHASLREVYGACGSPRLPSCSVKGLSTADDREMTFINNNNNASNKLYEYLKPGQESPVPGHRQLGLNLSNASMESKSHLSHLRELGVQSNFVNQAIEEL